MKYLFKKFYDKNANEGGGVHESQDEFSALSEKIDFNKASGSFNSEGEKVEQTIEKPPVEEPPQPKDEAIETEETEDDTLSFDEVEEEAYEEGGKEEEAESTSEGFDFSQLGEYSSVDDVKAELNELSELRQFKEELEKNPPAPKFENERQEQLYNFAKKFEGNEIAAMQSFLHIQGLELDSMSEKDVIIENWNLDPKYQDIPASERRDYLEAKYDKLYAEYDEDDVIQKQELRLAAKEARANLSKTQSDFQSAGDNSGSSLTTEEITKARMDLSEAIKDYDGNLSISISDEDGLDVNVELGAENLAENLTESIMNIPETWNNILQDSGVLKEDGSYDFKKYGQLIHEIQNRKQVYKSLYDQGATDREIYLRKKYGSPKTKPGADGTGGAQSTKTASTRNGFADQEGIASALLNQ